MYTAVEAPGVEEASGKECKVQPRELTGGHGGGYIFSYTRAEFFISGAIETLGWIVFLWHCPVHRRVCSL